MFTNCPRCSRFSRYMALNLHKPFQHIMLNVLMEGHIIRKQSKHSSLLPPPLGHSTAEESALWRADCCREAAGVRVGRAVPHPPGWEGGARGCGQGPEDRGARTTGAATCTDRGWEVQAGTGGSIHLLCYFCINPVHPIAPICAQSTRTRITCTKY